MEYPHGWVEDYHYDSIGQLLKVEDTDPSGKDMKQQKHVYKYDDCGNMTYEYMRGNGTGEATVENFYTYDALHRVTNAKENYGNASRTYQYDSLGNLTWETNSNNVTTDYKLNNLNQITEKSSDGWKTHTTFTYDKRGNLIQEQYGKNKKVTSIGTYTYDETNKMVEGVNANAESSSYLYNGLGALVEQTWVIAKNSYGYHDVLAEAVDPVTEEPETAADTVDSPEVPAPSDDSTTETDAVLDEAPADSADSGIMLLASSNKDHSGKKPSDKPTGSDVKKTSTVAKEFVVDYTTETHEPLMEHEVNGLDYRYVYGNDRLSVNITGVENGSSKLIENGNQIRLYYHMDYLGTADYLTSPLTGKVESWTHYNEWGEITHNAVLKCGQRELDLVKRYATHDFDAVLNQYYAKARFYDAENRHFTAMDPILDPSQYSIKGYVDNPMQLVQYLYVSNNPIVYIDFSGKWTAAIGANAAVAFILGVSVGAQVIIDDDGNIAVIGSVAGGAGTPNASLAGVVTLTSADTVHDLGGGGIGLTVGGSVGLAVTGGVEFSMTPTTDGNAIYATSFSAGVGPIPAELHANIISGSAVSPSIKWTWLYNIIYDSIKGAFEQLSCGEQDTIESKIDLPF